MPGGIKYNHAVISHHSIQLSRTLSNKTYPIPKTNAMQNDPLPTCLISTLVKHSY